MVSMKFTRGIAMTAAHDSREIYQVVDYALNNMMNGGQNNVECV